MTLVYFILSNVRKKKLVVEERKPASLQDMKLFTQERVLIDSYNKVYMVPWGRNIYNIYDQEEGELIIRIDKGDNMLLTAQKAASEKKESS